MIIITCPVIKIAQKEHKEQEKKQASKLNTGISNKLYFSQNTTRPDNNTT
jgi:hypothetical protein